MKARVTSWEVEERGPALWARQQWNDGSASYDGITEVTMKFDVVGDINAVKEFLQGVKIGQSIKALSFGAGKSKEKASGRQYVFE